MRQLSLFSACLLLATAAWADDCDEKAPRQADLPARGVNAVSIDASAGSLEVVGRAGATGIRAHGTACASTTSLLERVRLRATQRGSTAVITVDMPENNGWTSNRVARLDLIVEVPSGMDVRIDDGSGNMRVSNVGDLQIEDGSGSMTISNASGKVTIDDGSGDIELRNINGDAEIDDGSGSIDIRDVEGSLEIDDSSGGIQVRGVRRDVTVDDSSGGIDVADVGGDFTVRKDSSGGVNFANVRGRVDVPKKRH